MPTVSAAQKRLMMAAAHTPGGYGGVPQKVGKEFIAADGNIMSAISKCAADMSSDDWAGMAKWHSMPDEIAQDGAHAACGGAGCDSCGGSGLASLARAPVALDGADEQLLAFDRAPEGLDLRRAGVIVTTLAFDRDTGQGKTTDDFDRMHVKRAPITKAGVNPYYGREIPKAKELGLDPDKVYNLLRDPEEIKKGAASSHNVPLLSLHKPHTADEHDEKITVGTVGSEAEFEHPYLYNSLAVWSRDGRDLVDSKSQKELSSAYSYDADMTPGTYEGVKHDGVMRNMKWNHVCLVKKGRAGSDVALDEELQPQQETFLMSAKLKSLKAGVAFGAVTAHLRPVLAQDAQIDLGPAFAKITNGKFGAAKKGIAAYLKKALVGKKLASGKIAMDTDVVGIVEGVEKLMAAIEGDKTVEDADISDIDDTSEQGEEDGNDDTSMDSGMEACKAYLKSKGVSDEIIAGMPSDMASDEDDEDDENLDEEAKKKKEEERKKKLEEGGAQDRRMARDRRMAKDKKDGKEFVPKGAMDAAIETAREETRLATIKTMNEIDAARRHVHPVTGNLEMAFDSAVGVYHQALKMQGHNASKVKDVDALKQMWGTVAGASKPVPRIAQDSESVSDFKSEFPNMAKVRRG